MRFRRSKKPKHKHKYQIAAICPWDIPDLPRLEVIKGGHYWIVETDRTYFQCELCKGLAQSYYGRSYCAESPPAYVEARRYVLGIDKILRHGPRDAFLGLSKDEWGKTSTRYSGVFTVGELNEAFRLIKGRLLQSRAFYMKYVGKWHPGRNTVKMRDDWDDSYTTCPYCTARYKGEDGCPKCGGPAEG